MPQGLQTRFLTAALFAGAGLLIGYHLLLGAAVVSLKVPMGYSETVCEAVAKAWPHQYQVGHFIDAQDNYGPAYPTLCRPLIALGLDPYAAARLTSLIALALATVLLFHILRRYRCRLPTSSLVAAVFFALNAGSASLQARPDFLATLAIIIVLWLGRPECYGSGPWIRISVLLGAAGLAAYLTKPYCIFEWAAVSAFAILFGRSGAQRLRAAKLTVLSAIVIVCGVGAYALGNPYYLMETFFFHVAYAEPSLSSLLVQSRDFGILAIGLFSIVGFSLIARARADRVLLGGCAGTLDPAERGYWLWNLAVGAGVLALGLGWHKGAYLVYFLHLLLPPLAVVAALLAESLPEMISAVALLANAAVLLILAPALPRDDPGWSQLESDVARQRGPVVVDFLLEPLSHGRPNVGVAGNGIVRFALAEPALIGGQSKAIQSAAREVHRYLEGERRIVREGPFPEAIYVDCVAVPKKGSDGRLSFLAVTRNQHPDLLTGYDMSRYRPDGMFVIHPFFGVQNGLRQEAGTWPVSIFKFIRVAPGAPAAAIPFEFVTNR